MTKRDLKIVFFGTPDFAVESLNALLQAQYNVTAVVTATDKPAGRGHRMLPSAVKRAAQAAGIPVLQPESLKSPEFIDQLKSLQADLFIVIAFRMLPEVVWQMPPLGTFNLHASLLPKYRGAAPINWAVINGESETGVTTFFLRHAIDTGPIIAQERVDILPDDCAGDVHDRLMYLGARLTLDTVDSIVRGDLTPIPQDQLLADVEPTPAPKIFTSTCHIDWGRSAADIHNLIRGLSPYPAAWNQLNSASAEPLKVKITRSRPLPDHKPLAPGEVEITDGRMIAGTSTTPLEVLELQPAGKRTMAVSDYLRGARLTPPITLT